MTWHQEHGKCTLHRWDWTFSTVPDKSFWVTGIRKGEEVTNPLSSESHPFRYTKYSGLESYFLVYVHYIHICWQWQHHGDAFQCKALLRQWGSVHQGSTLDGRLDFWSLDVLLTLSPGWQNSRWTRPPDNQSFWKVAQHTVCTAPLPYTCWGKSSLKPSSNKMCIWVGKQWLRGHNKTRDQFCLLQSVEGYGLGAELVGSD